MNNNSPLILEEYTHFLRNHRKTSVQTIKAYSYDIILFLKFMKMRLESIQTTSIDTIEIFDINISFISQISMVDIIAFMNHLSNQRGNGHAAMARKTSCLKSFYHYLVNTKRYLDYNPCDQLELPKVSFKDSQSLDEDDIKYFVNGITGKHQLRDKAIVLMFLHSSLRLKEMTQIKLSNLNIENDKITIETENGEKKKIVIHKDCKESITGYLRFERPDTDCEFLFLSQRKNQMSIRTIQHLIKSHVEKNPEIDRSISSQMLRSASLSESFRK